MRNVFVPGTVEMAVASSSSNGFQANLLQNNQVSDVIDTSGFGAPPPTVVARFKRVVPGTYLIRINVDGSASALTVDSGTGLFNGPTVEVTTPP